MALLEVTRLRMAAFPHYLGGLSLGVVGAAAGGLIWYAVAWATNLHMSVLAMAVGVGGGYGTLIGTGRRRGRTAQALSLVIVLTGLIVTEGLVERLLWARRWAEEGIHGVAFIAPLKAYWNLISTGLTTDPPTILFFAIALVYALLLPRRSNDPYATYSEAVQHTPWG
jgi:hypothetical protein